MVEEGRDEELQQILQETQTEDANLSLEKLSEKRKVRRGPK